MPSCETVTFPHGTRSPTVTGMANENKELMRTIFDALARGDGAPFAAAMHPDFTWVIAGVQTDWSGEWRGKDAVRSELIAPLFARFADTYRSQAVSFTAEEDRVVVECRSHATTHAGQRYDQQYCFVCTFSADGRLLRLVEYADTALMQTVLGPPTHRGTPVATGAVEQGHGPTST
jgi:uncharacterized protein